MYLPFYSWPQDANLEGNCGIVAVIQHHPQQGDLRLVEAQDFQVKKGGHNPLCWCCSTYCGYHRYSITKV